MPMTLLTPAQVLDLRDALVDSLPSSATMDELLLTLDRSFTQLSHENKNFAENVMVVVRRADTDGWVMALVDAAVAAVPREPRFAALRRALRPIARPPGVDPFMEPRLTGNHYMVDRKGLRGGVRSIHAPLGKRILVVTGPRKSGKSHTLQYISYLREVLDNFRYVFVDLEAYPQYSGTPRVIEPIDIARTLVTKLGCGMRIPEPPSDMQWANWILEFCDAFEPHALDDPHRRWIVIDAFDKVVLSQHSADLVAQLAARIGQTLGRYRLVLLGYDGRLPDTIASHIEHQHIEPIAPRDVLEFFMVAHEREQIPCDEDVLMESVMRVMGDLDPFDEQFMPEIGPRISNELERMAGATS